jgi:membrane protease YdiL (CAAX protease family)
MQAASRRVGSPPPLTGSAFQALRAVTLVGVLMSWNAGSSRIAAGLSADLFQLTLRGLAFTALDLLVNLGLIVGVGCVWLGKTSLRDLGWRASPLPRLIALGMLQTALLVGLVFAVYGAMAGMRGVRGLAITIAGIPISERLVYVIAGAKVAFVEETLFRGDLLGKLQLRFGVVASVVLSSILFASFHRTLVPVPLAMKFVLGVSFAVFTLGSRSLVPSALGHWLLWVIVGNN